MESKYRGISQSVGIYLLFFLHDSYDMRGIDIKKGATPCSKLC